jgi:hypothetical protein
VEGGGGTGNELVGGARRDTRRRKIPGRFKRERVCIPVWWF